MNMVSLTLPSSSSRASLLSAYSQQSFKYASPSQGASSASSSHPPSRVSPDVDDEDVTVTSNRTARRHSKIESQEDLRLLAISTHITELSYSISDIQTRIFEIQELRHKSQSSGDSAGTTGVIDQSLMNLDEKLESVSKGMKTVNDALAPYLQTAKTPTLSTNGGASDSATILRKHVALMTEWEAVQDESDVLREELKEDKWLTVFRTVTDQADGMMSSLEKAVNRCQDFIWQIQRNGPDISTSSVSLSGSVRSDKSPLNVEVFNSLLESFEAKKKHYVPATSKVLSIIDKGVQDRVTKNGETLRRHAESSQRWRNLRERIARTNAEMEGLRKLFAGGNTPSEESHTSAATSFSLRNGHLATPPNASRSSHNKGQMSAISRSISPFRKFARKITGATKHTAVPVTPLTITKVSSREPSSDPMPTIRRQRSSLFSFRSTQPPTPVTPDRLGHRYSHSFTPDPSPRETKSIVDSSTIKVRQQVKQPWNSSTRISPDDRASTIKATPPKRPSIGAPRKQSEDIPPVPPLGPQYSRSISRASMTSSRPWSPLMSSVSTTASSNPPTSMFRPPSRAQTPSQTYIPTSMPRPRPKTPSHIPAPAKLRSTSGRQSETGWYEDENTATLPRTFSPSGTAYPPRPPSRSMIPLPSLMLPSTSRPSSAMSQYTGEYSALSSFRSSATRAQTPESALRARAQQIPFYTGSRAARLSLQKLPPSSYRDCRTPNGSRPASRAGAYTPTYEQNPVHEYIPGNSKDPLDVEVAAVANSIPHGLLVERVDPPLRTIPREGVEIRAQYAFSNALSRKVVTCRLTTMTRSGTKANGDIATTTKKVMCRVGGGWQDLQLYMLSRLDV